MYYTLCVTYYQSLVAVHSPLFGPSLKLIPGIGTKYQVVIQSTRYWYKVPDIDTKYQVLVEDTRY